MYLYLVWNKDPLLLSLLLLLLLLLFVINFFITLVADIYCISGYFYISGRLVH